MTGGRGGAVIGSAEIPWTNAMIDGRLAPHACHEMTVMAAARPANLSPLSRIVLGGFVKGQERPFTVGQRLVGAAHGATGMSVLLAFTAA